MKMNLSIKNSDLGTYPITVPNIKPENMPLGPRLIFAKLPVIPENKYVSEIKTGEIDDP